MWMNMCSERKVCRNTSEGRPRWKEWEKERDDKAWDRERESGDMREMAKKDEDRKRSVSWLA